MLLALRQCWVLFVGLLLIMLGNGLQGSLIGVRANLESFSNIMTGFVMGGYFVGLLAGSWAMPKLISSVGHVRVFGALTALASLCVILFPLIIDPYSWFLFRVLIGFCFAGLYIVCESWLNDRASNESRGQVLAIYMVITLVGFGGGQQLLKAFEPTGFQLFTIVSILISLAAVPVLMTAMATPSFEEPERMGVGTLYKVSPLGVIVITLVGVGNGTVVGMGAPYMLENGFEVSDASNFLALYSLGGLVMTWPLGKLSDLGDRRIIIAIAAAAAAMIGVAGMIFGMLGWLMPLLLASFLFGGASFPIYALCLAHTNDFLKPSQMVAASSTLLLANGAGAIMGSNIVGFGMTYTGPMAFFLLLAGVHLVMLAFTLLRMFARQVPDSDRQFVPLAARYSAIASTLHPDAAPIEESSVIETLETDPPETEATKDP